MKRILSRGVGSTVLAAAVFAVMLASGVMSARATFVPADPPVAAIIGLVQIDKVIDGLTERNDHNSVLQNRLNELQTNIDRMSNELKDLASKIEAMSDGPEKVETMNRGRRLRFQLEAEKEASQRELGALEAELLGDLCQKVEAACAAVATRDGYSLVLSNDQSVDVRAAGAQDVQTKMSLKRVLYAAPTHDITTSVITLMNNEYAASKAKN